MTTGRLAPGGGAAFLASEGAGCIAARTLRVNGGMAMGQGALANGSYPTGVSG